MESLDQAGWRLDALRLIVVTISNGAENGDGKLQSTAGTLVVILYQDDHIMVVNKPSGLLLCRGVWKSTKTA